MCLFLFLCPPVMRWHSWFSAKRFLMSISYLWNFHTILIILIDLSVIRLETLAMESWKCFFFSFWFACLESKKCVMDYNSSGLLSRDWRGRSFEGKSSEHWEKILEFVGFFLMDFSTILLFHLFSILINMNNVFWCTWENTRKSLFSQIIWFERSTQGLWNGLPIL